MAKMHSDGHGSSGSSKPVNKKNPRWVEYGEDEIKDLIIKLREDGNDPSQIGLKLRDQYGIPSVKQATDLTVTEILKEEGYEPEIPEDLNNLVEKAENLKEHLKDNPSDLDAERNRELTKDKIRKLASYYKEEGRIPENWEYED